VGLNRSTIVEIKHEGPERAFAPAHHVYSVICVSALAQNLTALQLRVLAYRFGLENEAAFPDNLVVELQPVQNRVKPI
jgi:hypothetical protein